MPIVLKSNKLPKITQLFTKGLLNSNIYKLTIKIDELIKEITDEFGITTVVITHDMSSVMGIGESIMFLYKGKKLWEGDNSNILQNTVPELNEFLFSSKLLQDLRK